MLEHYDGRYLQFDVLATLHHAQNIYQNFLDNFSYDVLLYTTKNKWSQNDTATDSDNDKMLQKAKYAYSWGDGHVVLTFSKNEGIQLPTGEWFLK